MVVPAAYKKAIQSLWTGLATITVRQGVLNLPHFPPDRQEHRTHRGGGPGGPDGDALH